MTLYKIAKQTNRSGGGVYVEIGSYLGASSNFLAAGLKNGTVYCIDTWKNDGMSEGLRDTYEEFLRNTKKFSGRIIPLRGKSTDIAVTFDKSIDLLFLDGDHRYESVKADIDAWWTKLRNGGTIIMHDIGWAEGVKKIVQEFVIHNSNNHRRLPNLFWAIKTL